MAITSVSVHGEILEADLTPAVGTVTFRILHELRDTVDNIVLTPTSFVATLNVNGEFTITLPTTDNPDITPLNWVYQVYVATTTWTETFYVQVPFAPGTTELADLVPLAYDPCSGLLASTPISPDDADLFVHKTGDTMTGNLSILANLQVAGAANVDGPLTLTISGSSVDVGQALIASQSTSVLTGGQITPNADPTKIDISALTGVVVTYDSSAPLAPTNPMITFVTYPGVVGLTPAFAPFTYYMVNSAGVLVQQATKPTPVQRRRFIDVGLSLTQGGIVIVDQTLPVIPSQLNNQLVDFLEAAGAFSTGGNVLGPNGANLTISKTVGTMFARAFSQVPDFENPHNATLAAQAPMNFRHLTALVGSAGPLTTLLNVGSYDPGGLGVVTPVGGGANSSTNFRVYGFANNAVNDQVLVQYGQNVHASLAAAVQAIPSGTYIPQPVAASGALLGWISVTRTATNLSDPAQAVFTKAAKFATP